MISERERALIDIARWAERYLLRHPGIGMNDDILLCRRIHEALLLYPEVPYTADADREAAELAGRL